MPFRFTGEDFERYVKMDEHGGRHIWHDLQDRLQRILAVPFTNNPYVARGDRLETLWLVPQGTPRSVWSHQAAFYLARNLKGKHLTFGLNVECPPFDWAEREGADTDRDGLRLIQRLESNPDFRARIDQLAFSPKWKVGMSTQGTDKSARSSEELLSAIAQIPEQQYWTAYVHQKMSAEEAIDAGEEIVDIIMAAYETLLALWLAVIPEADRQYLEGADMIEESNLGLQARAREVIESLLPNPEERQVCLNLMADYIIQAHELSQATWEVTLFHDKVRLNIGSIQTYVIDSDGIYLVMDAQSLSDEDRAALADRGEVDLETYETVPDTYDVRLPGAGLPAVLPIVKGSYGPLVERAFRGGKRTPYYKAHSPGVIEYMRRFLSRPEIPDPDYGQSAPKQFNLGYVLAEALASRGLQYSDWQIATFYTALQTKGFVILRGISGTGKTKLAQAFAEILPQPTRPELTMRDDLISITVQPYMPKYNRIIIPKHFTKLYEPPPRGESKEVQLDFDGKSQTCRLVYHEYANTNYIALYLRGEAAPWFSKSFQVDDTVVLEPRSDEDGRLIGFRMGKPSDVQFRAQTTGHRASNALFIPVRTDWRDSKSLLGYYNPLTGTYEWTDFLRFLMRAVQSYRRGDGLAWFVILDEMNLARVEYYFADLLSVLESGRDAEGWTREPLRLPYPNDAEGDLPPSQIRVPPNLYVIGTVNVDETTHSFSPKVLDRAFTLELTEADFSQYPPRLAQEEDAGPSAQIAQAVLADFAHGGRFVCIDKPAIADYVRKNGEIRKRLQMLNEQLRPYQLHFGYRIFDEIVTFLISAEANDLYSTSDAAFDAAVLMKVLPKFHGSRGKLENPLKCVLAWSRSPDAPDREIIDEKLVKEQDANAARQALENLPYRYKRTAAKCCRMLWQLYTSGFASFS